MAGSADACVPVQYSECHGNRDFLKSLGRFQGRVYPAKKGRPHFGAAHSLQGEGIR